MFLSRRRSGSGSTRIERNALVPLDNRIAVMREAGRDMDAKYKETSQGGIAVDLPGC